MEQQIAKIRSIVSDSIETKQRVLNDEGMLRLTLDVAELCADAFRHDRKVFFCGNGGSAADAQHLAAEFSGRFYFDRDPLFSEALHVNTSYITAVANDYSYDEIYSRMIIAKGRKGDVLVGISTSGNSKNVVLALEQAKSRGMITIGMTGDGGGKMKNVCDILLNVPSNDTPRIQECHIMIGQIFCAMAEKTLYNID